MSQLFAPADPKDIELNNSRTIFKGKTILWNVTGETTSREGKVTDVLRDQATGKIMLNVKYDSECSEHGFDTTEIHTKVDSQLVKLKPEPPKPNGQNLALST